MSIVYCEDQLRYYSYRNIKLVKRGKGGGVISCMRCKKKEQTFRLPEDKEKKKKQNNEKVLQVEY